jgi:pyruvate/2-oxoglutarate dehydrogenase complex dihydrolipoamide acyltransferase (E2) component
MGIKQFEAVINPPQGMIMAIGAGEKRPWVLEDGSWAWPRPCAPRAALTTAPSTAPMVRN